MRAALNPRLAGSEQRRNASRERILRTGFWLPHRRPTDRPSPCRFTPPSLAGPNSEPLALAS